MGTDVSFEPRVRRLSDVASKAQIESDYGLVKILEIGRADLERIRTSVNFFLWVCLNRGFPEKRFALSDDVLRDFSQDVAALPNITPNGLVLPKAENFLAYNQVQRDVAAAFRQLGFSDGIDRIQFPVNIRLQNGISDTRVDSRARASVKPHSDIWAGDPASGILVFLAVLGSADSVSIRYLIPRRFPFAMVRPLNDYLEGAAIAAESKELPCRFTEGKWFLVDPFVIHQTVRSGSGQRLSIDFRFIPKQRVDSDLDEDEARRPYFLRTEDWMRLGDDRVIVTNDTLADRGDPGAAYTRGYPVDLRIVDVKKAKGFAAGNAQCI